MRLMFNIILRNQFEVNCNKTEAKHRYNIQKQHKNLRVIQQNHPHKHHKLYHCNFYAYPILLLWQSIHTQKRNINIHQVKLVLSAKTLWFPQIFHSSQYDRYLCILSGCWTTPALPLLISSPKHTFGGAYEGRPIRLNCKVFRPLVEECGECLKTHTVSVNDLCKS